MPCVSYSVALNTIRPSGSHRGRVAMVGEELKLEAVEAGDTGSAPLREAQELGDGAMHERHMC